MTETNRCRRRTGMAWLLQGLGIVILTACGQPAPPPVIYVLGEPAAEHVAAETLADRPMVEVRPVLLPDYLDVTDILVRQDAYVVAPSSSGRWGERLSAGMARALGAALSRRLPDMVIVTSAPVEAPSLQVLVDVMEFEPRSDGVVVLIAIWRVVSGIGHETLAGEWVSLSEPIAGDGDTAMVATMSRTVEALADHIAAGVKRTEAAGRTGG